MQVFTFDFVPYGQDLTGRLGYPVGRDKFDRDVASQTYQNHVEQFQLCEELGFDGITLNEHHGSPYSLDNSPNVFLAYIAARTERLKLAMAGNLLPVHGHPLRVAEELAMLDVITRGRIVAGFVRGIPREYLILPVPLRESRPRFEEALDVILNAWTSELFSHEGRFYHYKDVDMWPRPYQRPHPPVWVGATTPEPTRNVARRPGVTLCVNFLPTSRVREQLKIFRDSAAEIGRKVTDEDVVYGRHIYVAETQKEAEKLCKPNLEYYFHNLLGEINQAAVAKILAMNPELDPTKVGPPYPFDTAPFEKLREDGLALVGTPDRVFKELMEQYEEVGGFGTFLGIVRMGAMAQDVVLRNIRLIGTEMIPKLHAVGKRPHETTA
ncbi:MAG TPA: LLM class flavin-dependent oxidoreductase [Candidatus Binatia bacterium]